MSHRLTTGELAIVLYSEQDVSVPVGKRWCIKGQMFDRAEVGNKLNSSEDIKEFLGKLDVLLDGNWNDLSTEGELYAYMDRLFDSFMESVRACMVGVSATVNKPRKRQNIRARCIRRRMV